MRVTMRWMLVSIATLMVGLEALAVGAVIPNKTVGADSQIALAELPSSESMLIARADRPTKKKIKTKRKTNNSRLRESRSGRPASTAEVEQFLNVHRVGMAAVPGCVSDGLVRDCERLVNSKTSLQNWCLQGKAEACSLFRTLSSQEAYQTTSDALRNSVR